MLCHDWRITAALQKKTGERLRVTAEPL